MWMDNLDEMLVDSGKTVTYKSLSRTLEVPANIAKQMLFYYHGQSTKAGTGIQAIYVVSGAFESGGRKFQLVHEDDLDSAKAGFATMRCEHIYSLQKGKHADPGAALHQADAHLNRVNVYQSSKWGVLKSKVSVRRSDRGDYHDVPASHEDSGAGPVVKTGGIALGQTKKRGKQVSAASFFGGGGGSKKKSSSAAAASSKKSPSEGKKNKSGGTFFAGDSSSKKAEKSGGKIKRKSKAIDSSDEEDEDEEEAKEEVVAVKEVKKDVAMKKAAEASEEKTAPADDTKEVSPAKAKSPGKAAAQESDSAASSPPMPKERPPLPAGKPPAREEPKKRKEGGSEEAESDDAPASKAAAKGKKAKKAKKETKPKKEAVVGDDEDGNVEDDDEDQASDMEEVEPAKPLFTNATVKKTRTVIKKVKKTFMNEKGYMVTEMVDVAEEVEVEDKPLPPALGNKPKSKPAAKKKNVVSGKKKQGSLMGFFTQKKKAA